MSQLVDWFGTAVQAPDVQAKFKAAALYPLMELPPAASAKIWLLCVKKAEHAAGRRPVPRDA